MDLHVSSDSQNVLQRHHRGHVFRCTIIAWYGNCSASDHKALQRVVRTAQYITGAKLPAIQDLYTRQCQRKALQIVKYSSHPYHRLLPLSATTRKAVPMHQVWNQQDPEHLSPNHKTAK